jgi:hypothetical protein
LLHGLHGQRDIAVAGDHDDRQRGVARQRAQQRHAVRAGQADIADHDPGVAGFDLTQRRFGAGHRARGDAFERERLLAAQPHIGVVFDDQHAQRLRRVRHGRVVVAHQCHGFSRHDGVSRACGSASVKHAPPSGWLMAVRLPPFSFRMPADSVSPRPSLRPPAWW